MKVLRIVGKIWSFIGGVTPLLDSAAVEMPKLAARLERIESFLGVARAELDEVRATRAEIKGVIADPDTGPHVRSLLERLDRSLDKIPLL